MTETKESFSLMDFVTPETTYEDLVDIVRQFVTPEDEKILGGQDIGSKKLADSVASLGVFAPSPATFDQEAFFYVCAPDLPQKEAERLFELNKRIGVLKDEGEGRVGVSPELVKIAGTQFLSDEEGEVVE